MRLPFQRQRQRQRQDGIRQSFAHFTMSSLTWLSERMWFEFDPEVLPLPLQTFCNFFGYRDMWGGGQGQN